MIYPPYDLKVEYLREPEAIDLPRPRFSWKLKSDQRGDGQTAYQIIVSSEKELVEKEIGDFWDSGKVRGNSSIQIPYLGEELLSCQVYYWRVRCWNQKDEASPFSEISTFKTGFMGTSKFKTSWISLPEPEYFHAEKTVLLGEEEPENIHYKAIYLRKEFRGKGQATRATIYICGLGHYVLFLNGQRIGQKVLDPAWSDYHQSAFYSVYEVGALIQENNAIGVILGNGRYLKKYGYDQPRLAFRMEIYYENGGFEIISSDESWRASHGPIQENGLYYGEAYDARLERPGWNLPGFDDRNWKKAIALSGGPAGLAGQNLPPVAVTEILRPVKINQLSPNKYIFDFGQNISGWARLTVRGQTGATVVLRYGELLDQNGHLNPATNDRARATDSYVLKGEGLETFEPSFTYHGFRYVEVSGLPEPPDENTLQGCFVHLKAERTGNFECSEPLLNQIHQMVVRTQRANLMSIPTDCPQRDERHGWLADAWVTAEASSFNFDLAAFYQHFLNLIRQAQKEDGSLPDFVPPYNQKTYPADPAWSAAYLQLCWHMYQFYGDREILRKHFQSLKKYVEFLRKKVAGNLQFSLGKYGDWCQPGSMVPKKTPLELVTSSFYYYEVKLFSDICQLVGRQEEAKEYRELAKQIKNAFNQVFLEENQYKALRQSPVDRQPDQTANLLPLAFDLVPEEAREKVWENLRYSLEVNHDRHLDTGILGTHYLFEVLDKFHRSDLALDIVLQESYPGWGYMIKEGATTLWERWEKLTGRGMNSHNHVMFGSVDAWFYKTLAGLSPAEPGWQTFRVKPFAEGKLTWARAEYDTPFGKASVFWKKERNEYQLKLSVPPNTKARVYFPRLWDEFIVEESQVLLWDGQNFLPPENRPEISLAENGQVPVFWVDSGDYHFWMKPAGSKIEEIS